MALALTREQVRDIDRRAIDDFAIPGIVLMENAGRSAAEVILDQLDRPGRPAVVVFCGGGNNGGDGYVVARHLVNHGFPVTVVHTTHPDDLRGDARIQAAIVHRMGVPLRAFDPADAILAVRRAGVVIDALLGTGFTGAVRTPLDAAIRMMGDADHAMRVALDVPSGLDCDTGRASGPAVEADLTVTFVASKIGFAMPGAARYTGAVHVADIGAPRELIQAVAAGR